MLRDQRNNSQDVLVISYLLLIINFLDIHGKSPNPIRRKQKIRGEDEMFS